MHFIENVKIEQWEVKNQCDTANKIKKILHHTANKSVALNMGYYVVWDLRSPKMIHFIHSQKYKHVITFPKDICTLDSFLFCLCSYCPCEPRLNYRPFWACLMLALYNLGIKFLKAVLFCLPCWGCGCCHWSTLTCLNVMVSCAKV